MSGRTLHCGKYCCIPGCNATGRTKDINLFGLPSGKKVRGYDTTKWREDMLKMLYGLRSPNNNQFKQKVEQRKAFICNLHFKDSDIWKGSKKCWLRHSALPTLNLPVKSHPARLPKARREILKHPLPDKKKVAQKEVQPNSLEQIINCIKNKHLPEHWNVLQCTDNLICLVRPDENFLIEKIKLTIHADLVINVLFYGMPAPSELISTIKLSEEPFLTSLKSLGNLKLCSGYSSITKATSWVVIHLYSYASAISDYSTRYVSKNCKLGLSTEDSDVCSPCRYQFLHDAYNIIRAEERRVALDLMSPSKNIKNLKSCSARRLSTSLQRTRKLKLKSNAIPAMFLHCPSYMSSGRPPKRALDDDGDRVESNESSTTAKKRCLSEKKLTKLNGNQPTDVPEIYFCTVPLCPNNSKQHPHLGFHLVPPRFPTFPSTSSTTHVYWRDFLLHELEIFNISHRVFSQQKWTSLPESTRICSVHFEHRHFRTKPSLGLPGSQVELLPTAVPTYCVHHRSVKSLKERVAEGSSLLSKLKPNTSLSPDVLTTSIAKTKKNVFNSLLTPKPGNFVQQPIPIYNVSFEDAASSSDTNTAQTGKQIVFTQIAQITSPDAQDISQRQIVAKNYLNQFGTTSSIYVVYSKNTMAEGNQFVCEKLSQNYGINSGQPYTLLSAFSEDPDVSELENVVDEVENPEPLCFNQMLGLHMEAHGCTDLEGVHCKHTNCNDSQFKINYNPENGFPIFRNPRHSGNGYSRLCQYCGEISSETGVASSVCSHEKLSIHQKNWTCTFCSDLYYTRESLLEHKLKMHSEKPLYICSHFNKSTLNSGVPFM